MVSSEPRVDGIQLFADVGRHRCPTWPPINDVLMRSHAFGVHFAHRRVNGSAHREWLKSTP